MSTIPSLSPAQALEAAIAARRPYQQGYFAFYSSILRGVVTEPALMTVPADDHLAHRGDGVFETLKCVDGAVYLWREHVNRLLRSAERIALRPPWSIEQLAEITFHTIRIGARRDCLVRVILSRGPGSLGVSPGDCPEPGLYVLVHEWKASFMETHPAGARVVTSRLPLKPSFFATIKTCNYLPNALLKKEALDAGADFALAFDEAGGLAEGATENAGIVTADGVLRVPPPDRLLAGTTLNRALELARNRIGQGGLRAVETAPISRADLAAASELLLFGTTLDVTSAVLLDGRPVGSGVPGPVGLALDRAVREDVRNSPTARTRVF